jgi:GR25 family glycosyltransferase involved in LPS biosynthesis
MSTKIKTLYQMVFDLHQIFVNSGIKYSAFGELLLGAVVYKGLVPKSEFVQFCITGKESKKTGCLKKILKKCGYQLEKVRGGYRVSRKSVYADIITFRKHEDLYYNRRVNQFLPLSTLDSLQKYDFGTFKIFGPKQPEKILTQKYGVEWLDIIKAKPAKPCDVVSKSCIHGSMCLRPTKKIRPEKYITKLKLKRKRVDSECLNNFDKNVGVYVINCDVHKERMEKFTKHAKQAGLKFCRESCVKGKEFTYNLFCEMKKKKLLSKRADMNAIEIAINMSHYNCWTRMLNNKEDYALILEDDSEVHHDFVPRVNNLVNELEEKNIDFSILFLWSGNWMNTIGHQKHICTIDGMKIMQETVGYNNGCVAYIISKKFAEILMKKMYPITMPQDMLLGDLYKIGRHLTIKMKKEKGCYVSPLLSNPCEGEGGTGNTTQDYGSPSIKHVSCKKC